MVRSKSVAVKEKDEAGSSRVSLNNPFYSTVENPEVFIKLAGLPPSAEVVILGPKDNAFHCPEGYICGIL